jgi:hypothetical protein
VRIVLLGHWAWAMLALPLAAPAAEPAPPVLTLLEGTATLVRGVMRHALAEGVRLQSGDILETGEASLAEMEFADGAALTLGPEARMLAASLPLAGAARGDFYFPQGAAKLGRVKADARLRVVTPFGTVQPAEGAAVLRVSGSGMQVFAESGPVAITGQARRGVPAETLRLRTGEFFSGKSVQRAGLRPRPTPEFIAALPKLFLDPLPSRLARVKDRSAQPRQLDVVAYAAVETWLKAPYAFRRPMPARFRALADDPAFRAALIANMRFHPEWDRVLFPEKYEPKEPAAPGAAAPPPAGAR